MKNIGVVVSLLFSSPTFLAHREGSGSQESSGSHLGTSSEATAAASAAAAAEKVFSDLHERLKQCEGVEERETDGTVDTQEKAKKLEDCVNAIAKFAETTKAQRDKSMEANQKYADDMLKAKQYLTYLMKETDKHESHFNEYKNEQERKQATMETLLAQLQQHAAAAAGGAGSQASLLQQQYGPANLGPSSLMSMGQMPMMGNQAMAPPPWTNMAAMFTPRGQNFGVPGSLVGRRPSLLQVNAGAPPMSRDLQAKLDNEAAQLEAEELGVVDPDA